MREWRESRRVLKSSELLNVYKTLRKAFGPQHWWPADTAFEVIVGAILTQNTAWKNVERAIKNLKKSKKLSPEALRLISPAELAPFLRPAGYFNIKATRLKNFIDFLFREFEGDLARMFRVPTPKLREMLLSVNGIGPETADSILLYAGGKPVFVMDAYTKRIFSRHRLEMGTVPKHKQKRGLSPFWTQDAAYRDWQTLFERSLPRRVPLYNDFHAQIVAVGKDFCRSRNPLCKICPLQKFL